MFSQRGVLSLGHTHDMRELHRRVNANRLNGIDAEMVRREVKAFCPILDTRPDARYPVWAPPAAARRHRAPRRGGLGLRARRRALAASTSSRTARSPAFASRRRASRRRDHPRRHRAPGRSGCVAAGHPACWPTWRACACPSKATRCRPGQRADQAGARHRDDVERGARLCQPVRQGRAGHGRRHRLLQLLCPARQPADSEPAECPGRAVSGVPPLRAAQLGRHRRRAPGREPDHPPHAGATASTSTAAGAPAASRPRPARAGCSPTPSPRTGPTRSMSPSPWSVSSRASDRRAGAAGVAH